MYEPPSANRKIVIAGAGAVGSSFAYAMLQNGGAGEIALIDANQNHAKGQALDLVHGLPFVSPVDIHVGSPRDYADASVIVIAAGASQKPGETRLDLLQKNASIIRSIMDDVCASNTEAVVVLASNPVDVLTHVAIKHSGWHPCRIIGSGTVLDSSRFRYLLSRHCGVDARNIHAYILGEHGDSEVPAWSMTHIAGIKIEDYCAICGKCGSKWHVERAKIAADVRDSAYHIINYKGATYYAIGLALVRIVNSILRDEHSVLTVSTLLSGQYSLADVCLSVPCVVGRSGVERIVTADLPENEAAALTHSATILRDMMAELDGERSGGRSN